MAANVFLVSPQGREAGVVVWNGYRRAFQRAQDRADQTGYPHVVRPQVPSPPGTTGFQFGRPVAIARPRMRGAGDVVAKATKAVGVRPCAPCERRRQRLNKLFPFR